jgi:putative phage-type endonuclease
MDTVVELALGALDDDGVLLMTTPSCEVDARDWLHGVFGTDEMDDDVYGTFDSGIDCAISTYFGGILPSRSLSWSRAEPAPSVVVSTMQALVAANADDQRSDAWFAERNNMLTASTAWKILGSQASRNSLIWEKVSPAKEQGRSSNVDGPTHWGERYEPVAIAVYERMCGHQVSQVGCIRHPRYPFIGASPDGVVVETGRGVEIKCVVSRTLTGVPTKAYWAQMQWQAECAGMEEIDFLECKFVEYESEQDAAADGSLYTSTNNEEKGVMQQFHGQGGTYYEYMPRELSQEGCAAWLEATATRNQDATWVTTRWWKLAEHSCVVVPRQREWFAAVLPLARTVWDEVLHAREFGGCDRYKPANRQRRAIAEYEVDLVVDTLPLFIASDEE